eukprot:3295154-Rhodomonas_salina.1
MAIQLPPSANWYSSSACDWSASGLIAFAAKNVIRLLDASSREMTGALIGHTDRVTSLEFSQAEGRPPTWIWFAFSRDCPAMNHVCIGRSSVLRVCSHQFTFSVHCLRTHDVWMLVGGRDDNLCFWLCGSHRQGLGLRFAFMHTPLGRRPRQGSLWRIDVSSFGASSFTARCPAPLDASPPVPSPPIPLLISRHLSQPLFQHQVSCAVLCSSWWLGNGGTGKKGEERRVETPTRSITLLTSFVCAICSAEWWFPSTRKGASRSGTT